MARRECTEMQQPLVSVIISNYNYAGYVGAAINSALTQSFPNVEVVVVDDGSTDGSHEAIESYQGSVRSLFKDNGGQASAMNAGFDACQGEIVIFLDADDMLHSDIIELVVNAFERDQAAVKVQFRMEEVDVEGRPTGVVIPYTRRRYQSGDLRQYFARYHTYTWPWTSGNAYRTKPLREILPIPEEVFRISADAYLANTSVMAGPIVSLEEIGCYYRVHGQNNFTTSKINLENVRDQITRFYEGHSYLKKFADEHGLDQFPATADELRCLDLLVPQIVSCKLDPDNHPVSNDSRLSLLKRAVIGVVGNPEFTRLHQFAQVLWLAAFVCSPQFAARRLMDARHSIARGG